MRPLYGRDRPCKSTTPDIKNIYVETYVKYSRSELPRNKTRLFNFPKSFFNKLQLTSKPSFSQQMTIDKGSIFYTQTLSCTFGNSIEFDNSNFQNMAVQDLFVLIEFWDDTYVLMGLLNGAAMTSHDVNEKHVTSVTFEAKETSLAHYVTDLVDGKIIIFDNYNAVYQDDNNQIFNDDNNIIF